MAIYMRACLSIDEQQKTIQEAKEYYNRSKLDPKKKYLSDYENKGDWKKEGEIILYGNRTKIIKVIYNLLGDKKSPHEFLSSLKEYKPIYRDGKIHDPRCEFAIGDSCFCPCGEQYHGWHGRDIPKTDQVK